MFGNLQELCVGLAFRQERSELLKLLPCLFYWFAEESFQ
jgi:hypothetical protein